MRAILPRVIHDPPKRDMESGDRGHHRQSPSEPLPHGDRTSPIVVRITGTHVMPRIRTPLDHPVRTTSTHILYLLVML